MTHRWCEFLLQGQKGLKEFAAQFQNYQHTMLFGCIRIVGKDRVGGVSTNRVKYVYVTFVGNGVPELSRAQFNPLKAQVERFFGVVQLTVHMTGSSIDLDLSPNQLGFRLQNSSGSHKSEIFDFGGGLEVDAASFTHADSDVSSSNNRIPSLLSFVFLLMSFSFRSFSFFFPSWPCLCLAAAPQEEESEMSDF